MPATLEPPKFCRTVRKTKQIKHPLAKRAEEILKASSYHELRRVRCEVRGATLMLSGRVSSFYMKQIAQTLVRKIEGAFEIANSMDVSYPDGSANR